MIGPDIPAHLLQGKRSATPDSEEEGPLPPPTASSIGPEIPSNLLRGDRSTTPGEGPTQSGPSIGPAIPTEVLTRSTAPIQPEDEEEEEDDYAPALPPELLAARAGSSKAPAPAAPARRPVGPTFPSIYRGGYDDDSDDDVGPMPLPEGVVVEEKDGVQEFLEKEERRRKQVEVCLMFYPFVTFTLWMLICVGTCCSYKHTLDLSHMYS